MLRECFLSLLTISHFQYYWRLFFIKKYFLLDVEPHYETMDLNVLDYFNCHGYFIYCKFSSLERLFLGVCLNLFFKKSYINESQENVSECAVT